MQLWMQIVTVIISRLLYFSHIERKDDKYDFSTTFLFGLWDQKKKIYARYRVCYEGARPL